MAIVISFTAILIVNMLLVVGSNSASGDGEATLPERESTEATAVSLSDNKSSIVVPLHADPPLTSVEHDDDDNDPGLSSGSSSDTNWRCACEGGFLPPGLLKSFGGAEAAMRLGTGQCYHQKAA